MLVGVESYEVRSKADRGMNPSVKNRGHGLGVRMSCILERVQEFKLKMMVG